MAHSNTAGLFFGYGRAPRILHWLQQGRRNVLGALFIFLPANFDTGAMSESTAGLVETRLMIPWLSSRTGYLGVHMLKCHSTHSQNRAHVSSEVPSFFQLRGQQIAVGTGQLCARAGGCGVATPGPACARRNAAPRRLASRKPGLRHGRISGVGHDALLVMTCFGHAMAGRSRT